MCDKNCGQFKIYNDCCSGDNNEAESIKYLTDNII